MRLALAYRARAVYGVVMDANIATLKTELQTYVDQVTNDLVKAKAQVKLDQYIAAEEAYSNINQSAAASYSDVIGTVTKDDIETRRQARDIALQELTETLLQGGVELPSESGIAYWSLGAWSG